MKRTRPAIDLFRYRDYRQFLRDWYAQTKRDRRSFSFRAFSQRAGFRSPNFLKLVMDGDRNLTEESVVKFMNGLNLNKQEQEFFRDLVFFNQSTNHELKDKYYRNMLRSRRLKHLTPIEGKQYEYYSKWYHPVVRELVNATDFDGRAEWIAQRLNPPITNEEAARSLALLARLGFIEQGADGRWKQSSTLVSTGPEPCSHTVFTYHLGLLDLTKEILRRTPPAKRDISALTLGVARERLPQIKKMVQEFREEIMKLVSEDVHPEEVVQLNVQMYPVTSPGKDDER